MTDLSNAKFPSPKKIRKAQSFGIHGAKKAAAMPDFGDDEWTKMVCIETCNVNNCEVELQPDDSHVMTAKIDMERV